MKKLLLPILFLIYNLGNSQSIDVNNPAAPETSFTAEQLISDVLIGGGDCTEVNFVLLQDNPAGAVDLNLRSWGYFDATGTSFPFPEGIILSSGFAIDAEGPNNSSATTGAGAGWPGDNDLKIILDNQSGDNQPTNNATIFQFTFVPVIANVSFDFIFASEEYEDDFECDSQFRDGFAFLLRGPGIPNDSGTPYGGTNIAAVPGSANVPVSTLSIHADYFTCGTEIVGVNFFPNLYISNWAGNNQNEIQFDGYTQPLSAQATLIPGETYELKMVIADRGDSSFDSAVFFRAGSFDIGSLDLGLDLTIENGTARCEGEIYTINPQINNAPPGTTYEWQYESPLGSGIFLPFIPPQESTSLNVTVTGNYKLIVDFAGVCESEGTLFVEFATPPVINETPSPLILCDDDNNGFAPFTLSDADMDITLGDPLLTVTYHGTELDAINNVFPLPTPYVNDSPYEDEVWARVESSVSSCYTIVRLLLYVRNTPQVLTPEPLRLCDYNNPGDGFEVFDLTQAAPEILNGLDPTHYDLYYYVNQGDAVVAGDSALLAPPGDYSQAIVTPGAYQNQVPFNQIIYVLVVGNANSIDPNTDPASNGESCYAIVELELIVDPLPVANLPLPYELCDDEINGSTLTDELSTFDLTTRDIEITGGDLTLNVTWYETPADEAADNAIVDPTAYQNRTIAPATQPTPQTIIARVTDIRGCKSTTTLTLVVLPNPIANEPTPLEECDSGTDLDDGISTFDLTQRDAQIIGIQTDVTVTYYTTQAAAEAGVPGTEIANPTTYVNTTPYLDSVWARVEKIVTPPSVSPACYDVIELQLIVVPLPDVPTAGFGDLFSCDQDGDGNALFDLTQNSPFVIGVQTPSDFIGPNYYTNIFDAAAGVPGTEIATPTLFLSTSSPQPIWVRLESLLTGCVRISTFNLIVGTFPTIINPLDKEACDDEASGSNTDGITIFDLTQYTDEITGGNSNYTVFYYATQQDQIDNNPILNPAAYANEISPEQTIYVSVINTEGCEAQTTLLLRVLPLPNAVDAEYALCDPDNDGYAFFDLETMTVVIANGETDVLITYYETLLDAEEGVNALDTTVLYENLSTPMQTLWVRVIRDIVPPSTTPACYTVVELTLIVNPTPVVPLEIDPIVRCDEDETAEFDLTQNQEIIYGIQNPLAYTLTYHETLLDAEAGTNAIATPESYTNTSNPQTIYVRLTDNETGCYKVSSFEIEVSVGPVANLPTPLDSCDDLGEPNDGITTFDLTVKEDEITGGVAGVEVRFYEMEEDAQNDVNRINPETAYVNTVNLQTIYVRVIDGNTGCVSFTRLLLRVFPNPTPSVPDALELCDDNNAGDGIEAFNLLDAQAQILNGANWDVLYYATQAEALVGDPTQAIDSSVPYENTTPWLQILYVRVTNTTTGCFEIVELILIVHPLPDDSAVLEDLIACEINTDGVATFNLEDKTDEILNGQDPLLHNITFYRSDVEAQAGINPIVNTTTFQNTINPEPIYTGIFNTETGCYIGGVQFFLLRVLEGATATTPAAPLIACEDEEGSGIGTFDLSSLNAEILNGQDPSLYILTYHESLAEAESGDNPIASTTTNYASPTATLWARVTYPIADPEQPFPAGCYAVVEIQLVVDPLPVITIEDSYRLCVDAFGNPIVEEFGSTSPPVIDTGLSTPEYSFIWEIDGEVQFGENQGSIVATQAGVYTVTVTNQTTGCENSASTTVVLSSPPLIYDAQTTSGAFANIHTIEASASGLGSYVYQLDDGPFQSSGLFENVSAGSHIITITDENGCGSVEIEVGVIDYPRFFTPNNDGFHERWNIIGIATNPTAKIYIFDRHGKLLKQISPTSAGWDGTYNGNPLPSSDYWFRVEYTEDDTQKQFRGHFTLKR